MLDYRGHWVLPGFVVRVWELPDHVARVWEPQGFVVRLRGEALGRAFFFVFFGRVVGGVWEGGACGGGDGYGVGNCCWVSGLLEKL